MSPRAPRTGGPSASGSSLASRSASHANDRRRINRQRQRRKLREQQQLLRQLSDEPAPSEIFAPPPPPPPVMPQSLLELHPPEIQKELLLRQLQCQLHHMKKLNSQQLARQGHNFRRSEQRHKLLQLIEKGQQQQQQQQQQKRMPNDANLKSIRANAGKSDLWRLLPAEQLLFTHAAASHALAPEQQQQSSSLPFLENEKAPHAALEAAGLVPAAPAYFYGDERDGVPVFEPSMAAFADFEAYVRSVFPWGLRYGIVKIVPPPEWLASLPDIRPKLAATRISHAITQHFVSAPTPATAPAMLPPNTAFNLELVETRNVYSPAAFAARCMKAPHAPPYIINANAPKGKSTDTSSNTSNTTSTAATTSETNSSSGNSSSDNKADSPRVTRSKARKLAAQERLMSRLGLDHTEGASLNKSSLATAARHAAASLRSPEIDGDSCFFVEKRDYRPEPEPGDSLRAAAALMTPPGSRNHCDGPKGSDLDALRRAAASPIFYDEFLSCRFNVEFMRALEEEYWLGVGSNRPMYGADLAGTLLRKDVPTTWNPNRLDKLLTKIIALPGVNTPYLYFGSWGSTFGWHVEDVNLFSINYLHFGAPKYWFALAPQEAPLFEALCRSIYPEEMRVCPEFIRHKTLHLKPHILETNGMHVKRLAQFKNEIVVTFPRAYHSGFNTGFNCAESVNFATREWFDYGRDARRCTCRRDSVVVSAAALERIDSKAASGEGNKDAVAAQSSTLTTNNTSIDAATTHTTLNTTSTTSDKKNRETIRPFETSNLIRSQLNSSQSRLFALPVAPPQTQSVKPITYNVLMLDPPYNRLLKRGAAKKDGHEKPVTCILCPDTLETDEPLLRLRLHESNARLRAHRRCAQVVPETWVEKDHVCGVELIPNARFHSWRCETCLYDLQERQDNAQGPRRVRRKRRRYVVIRNNENGSDDECEDEGDSEDFDEKSCWGAIVRCAVPKCERGYHVPCAIAEGLLHGQFVFCADHVKEYSKIAK